MKLFKRSRHCIQAAGVAPEVVAAVQGVVDAFTPGDAFPHQEWLFDWHGGRRVTGVFTLHPTGSTIDTALREARVLPAAAVLALFPERLGIFPALLPCPSTGNDSACILGEDGILFRVEEFQALTSPGVHARIREVFSLHLQSLGLRLKRAGEMELDNTNARGFIAYAMETDAVSPRQAKQALSVYFGDRFLLAQERTMAGLTWALAAALVGSRPGPWAKAAGKVSRLLPRLSALAVEDSQKNLFKEPTATEGLAPLEGEV